MVAPTSTANTPLNSTPEILLRKRRHADRIRIEKQQLAKKRQEEAAKLRQKNKKKFTRAESIVAKTLATEREKERIKRISKLEAKKSKNEMDHLPSTKDFILKISEKVDADETPVDNTGIIGDADDEEEDDLIREKITYNGEPTLFFVIRVRGPTAVNIPHKAFKILSLLRLQELNTGVFVKMTKTVYPLLKLIAPYIVVGKPSLSSIRSLIQKRSKIVYKRPEDTQEAEIVLNDNNIVEEKLGDCGIICIEDMIHEINSMGENFQPVNFFLQPFKLNREVAGFSSLNKLNKIKAKEQDKKMRQLSNSAVAPIIQLDIDSLIAKLN
ncbi:Rlp7p KNAG_0I01290 [Huiozyma naganishii CBS 8797]|uniref:Ribosome biogenesis protein RLP7 n=1 Tax=Huiozyma naganishii (strain ATCC MYA-139 / BCRC 22969 / CBS 8797 / KCTC 17520 / NBRC 10181 / NCYC 3082 / Yp74L-3) TaxID=1071383 RepID=J7RAL5_HUIN7|nr:hypothetical protein KNAG_0I01290 [Kazachstania naganishii CBS 8797]CCK71920.1 hypothetical protein KNAG_0I01290 [Kazachstania naganishii CBS 8797]